MKELSAYWGGKSLACNGWGFQILLLTAQKSSGDGQNFTVFPSVEESSVLISDGDEILKYLLSPGTIFWLILPVGRGNS